MAGSTSVRPWAHHVGLPAASVRPSAAGVGPPVTSVRPSPPLAGRQPSPLVCHLRFGLGPDHFRPADACLVHGATGAAWATPSCVWPAAARDWLPPSSVRRTDPPFRLRPVVQRVQARRLGLGHLLAAGGEQVPLVEPGFHVGGVGPVHRLRAGVLSSGRSNVRRTSPVRDRRARRTPACESAHPVKGVRKKTWGQPTTALPNGVQGKACGVLRPLDRGAIAPPRRLRWWARTQPRSDPVRGDDRGACKPWHTLRIDVVRQVEAGRRRCRPSSTRPVWCPAANRYVGRKVGTGEYAG
jgi:hypothetical protein